MQDINDDEDVYVCITHQSFIPCEKGEQHLISNWKTDVDKIKKIMKEN